LAGIIFAVLHFGKNTQSLKQIDTLQAPDSGNRLLIVSPHPDDESLGAGGLISEAVARGATVKVVFVTNGDGFHLGVERYYHDLRAGKKDALKYGGMRQQEALAADAALGVSPDNVLFLGFPDQGTYSIWKSHWDQKNPYTSKSTGQSKVAYQLAVNPGEPYTAPALMNTLGTIIKEYHPTDILVTDTSDIHPDHLASGAFTLATVAELEGDDPSFRPNVYTFVIHSSIWQLLPSVEKHKIYVPPSYFLDQGNGWYKLPLTGVALAAKKEALAAYKSQEQIIATLMDRFEGPDELFCLQIQRQLTILDPGSLSNGMVTVWPDTARISFNADANPDILKSNDLRAAYLGRTGNDIYLRLNMLGRMGIDANYVASIYLLPNKTGAPVRRFTWRMTPRGKRVVWLVKPADYISSGASFTYANNQIDMALPNVIKTGDNYLMFNDDTTNGGVVVAQVPWCLLKL
jgi:LmbE family N-acetylglucosaminyl deacetylase